MGMKRRDFLKSGAALSALTVGMMPGLPFGGSVCPPALQRRLLAGPTDLCDKKLLFIFLTGGMDGINAVIPQGDSSYSTNSRPTLHIPDTSGIDLGNGFAQLHPLLDGMMDIYNAGDLALVHRVGYRGQNLSHFSSRQFWQNGTLDGNLEVGIFNRLIESSASICSDSFPAAAIYDRLPVALRGPRRVPHFRDPRDYGFHGTTNQVSKLIGQGPSAGTAGGLLGFYEGTQDFPNKPYRDEIYSAGNALIKTLSIIENVNPSAYSPGGQYPGTPFGERARIAAQLFKETPAQIIGIELDGWDTHAKQAHGFDVFCPQLGGVFRALYHDLQDQWDDLVVMTMSEFGRTSDENGSTGTDHAHASVMFVAGGAVNGGVYNCDATTWSNGDIYSFEGRYLAHRTDFRSVLGEVFRGHFGDSDAVVGTAIPNYSGLASADPLGFTPLGLFG